MTTCANNIRDVVNARAKPTEAVQQAGLRMATGFEVVDSHAVRERRKVAKQLGKCWHASGGFWHGTPMRATRHQHSSCFSVLAEVELQHRRLAKVRCGYWKTKIIGCLSAVAAVASMHCGRRAPTELALRMEVFLALAATMPEATEVSVVWKTAV